jgi:predicted  nucleic acid-binding Zn-ribbon protein
MKRYMLGAFALALAACDSSGGDPQAARISRDSTAYYRGQAQELTTVNAVKDSLVRDLAETTKLMADINTELAKVSTASRSANEPVVGAEGAASVNERQQVLKRVTDLTTRIRSSEQRLASSQRRLRDLTKNNDSLRVTLADFQATIDGLQATVESQKNTIATLEADLTGTRQQVATLTTEKATLTDTVSAITERENTVYYVIGTKTELKDRGLVREEGGTRFLIFTRTGEVLKPAPELDPSAFTLADRRTMTEIALPNPAKEYQLVTNQNIAYSNIPLDAKGKIKGTLQITSPERFWGNSKFLILVEK